MKQCPECGVLVFDENRFCTSCGASLASVEPGATEVKSEAVAENSAEEAAETTETTETVVEPAEEAQAAQAAASSGAIKYIAAALAVGIACIGGGAAVGKIGSAAMGAMSENAELSGKALPFVGLAEGICLWGFLVALFIILM